MRHWRGCVKADFHRMFLGWGFWAAVLMVFLVQCLSVMDTWAILKQMNIFEIVQMISSIDSQFQELIYIIVALPFAAAYAEEVRSRYLTFQLSRGDWRAHVASKLLVNAVSAGLAVMLGLTLFLLFCQIRGCAPASTVEMDLEYWLLDGIQWLIDGHPVRFLAANFGLRALYATVWATAAMAVSAYCQNVFIVLISPEVVHYLIGYAESALGLPLSMRISYLQEAAFGFVGMGEAYSRALLITLPLLIGFGALFVLGVRRKVSKGV